MRRLRKFLRLTSADRRMLVQAWMWLEGIRLGLWIFPFQKVFRYLTLNKVDVLVADEMQNDMYQHVVWAIETAGRYGMGKITCLSRALAAFVLLKKMGYPSDLKIGVSKNEKGKLEAHAWLENGDGILLGNLPDLDRYIRLSSLEKPLEYKVLGRS